MRNFMPDSNWRYLEQHWIEKSIQNKCYDEIVEDDVVLLVGNKKQHRVPGLAKVLSFFDKDKSAALVEDINLQVQLVPVAELRKIKHV